MKGNERRAMARERNRKPKSPHRLSKAKTGSAAGRALSEAEARRKEAGQGEKARAKEIGGRDGPDPVRYGDWEKEGIISDF